ncbi:MAG: hypothetical protein ACRC33_00390 [Gemmataceae bacterium]
MTALLLLVAVGAGDVESGPEKGAKVPELKAYVVTGDDADKTVEFAAARKDKVTVFLVVGEGKFDRPMNRFIKTLDEKLGSDFEDVAGVAVFPTDDEDKMKGYLPRVQMSVKYDKTAMAVVKGKDGPKDWGINSDAHLTVILTAKGKVVARFGYKSVNDTEVPDVVKELEKHAKKK